METFLRVGLGNALLATILALGAAGAGCLLRRRPAVRHGLWLLVLLKLVTPPLWVIPLTSPEPTSTVDEGQTSSKIEADRDTILARLIAARLAAERLETAFGPSRLLPSIDWTRWAATTWLTGSLVTLAVTGLRIRRWNRLLRLVEPASDDVQEQVEHLAKQMGLARPPTSWWFPGPAAPMLWALGCQARLIVPSELWSRLDDRQRITLLVHELAHLRRKDHWVRVVELVATAFYWWLPLAWIARWALREAEEQCCDAWVVWTCPDALRAYAETLLDTVDFLSETGHAAPLAASGFGHAHHLKRRVTMIMQGKTPRDLGWTGLLTMLGLSALLLPLSPTWAQKADDEDQAKSEAGEDVQESKEGSERSELENLKRKLAEETRRLQSLEKRVVGKETVTIKPGEGSAKEQGESSPKASSPDGNTIIEFRAHDLNAAKTLKSRPTLFEAKELQFHFTDEHRGAIDREVARAKAEVERARAQLHRAESQLAKLGDELKTKQFDQVVRAKEQLDKIQVELKAKKANAKELEEDSEDSGDKDKVTEKARAVMGIKGRPALNRELFIVRDVERIKKLEDEVRHLVEKKLAVQSPEKDRRIADLEKKLDELIDEVKHLKSERGDSKK
ncbi:Signal transducer regulating beta-lactamase production, contains metallopeptidase domain [Singulisphaera sp. GP187]|uniref:M56 family metallopeptidase n=1 Tax=Singulisphaera sp. GP187 TaxID=1882752 RepID=UPI00092A1E3C|nr:M56 family metallopeptidase [Singulisphaera sp. GP187]SIO65552.1 Signal transducer regulating beta-lactamase production, contains metallopeptidase domain [Singulisphaera sp. GP187]